MWLNPYSGTNFFTFFVVLFLRIWHRLSGRLPWNEWVLDELQILVLLFIALSAALVGTFLVLQKLTMLANALSHTVLLGIVLASLLMRSPEGFHVITVRMLLLASLITGFLNTTVMELLCRKFNLQKDASIGLTFTALFALGIVLVTLFVRNTHLGVEAIMGNVDALHVDDLKLSLTLFVVNAFLILCLFQPLVVSTFDRVLGRNLAIPVVGLHYLLMIQSASISIGAFRAVGAFIFLALLVAPTVTARHFTHDLKKLMGLSALIGGGASVVAVALSRHLLSLYGWSLSTAGLVTVILSLLLLLGVMRRGWQVRGKERGRCESH